MQPYWVTKDHRRLLISEMTTRHIKNCLRLMRETYQADIPAYQWMTDEIKRREQGRKDRTKARRLENANTRGPVGKLVNAVSGGTRDR